MPEDLLHLPAVKMKAKDKKKRLTWLWEEAAERFRQVLYPHTHCIQAAHFLQQPEQEKCSFSPDLMLSQTLNRRKSSCQMKIHPWDATPTQANGNNASSSQLSLSPWGCPISPQSGFHTASAQTHSSFHARPEQIHHRARNTPPEKEEREEVDAGASLLHQGCPAAPPVL